MHDFSGEADEVKEVTSESSTDISEPSAKESESLMETSPTSQSVSANTKQVIPDLTLVLIGDTNSTEIGSNNILLDPDEQADVEQFSSRLYDLCGRHISVINMLGLQNTDQFPLNQGVDAFVLLLPNGQHSSHYSSGVQWLEKAFGKESLSYVMTVVTHKSDENCDNALTDLKSSSRFDEKRYHTCTRSMMDGSEIIDLLEKIDAMVSGNDPQCYSRLMPDEKKEHLDNKTHKEEQSISSVFQQNQTGKADEVKDVDCEHSSNMSVQSIEKSETLKDTGRTSQPGSTVTEERCLVVDHPAVDEVEQSETKAECDPVKAPSDVEHSKNNDDSTTVGESDTSTKEPSARSNLDRDMSNDKSVTTSEEISGKNQCETLLHRLHLQDNHQQKLSLADFLKIGPPVKKDHETCEKDLAQTFLQRLLMLDHRARYIPVRQDSSKTVPVLDTAETEESDLYAFCNMTLDTDQSKQTHVHPMDVQMAVFHCSDSLLRQMMITKLSQCQYALPLLVPDPVTIDIECPLWTFRQIIKTWKITQTKDDANTVTMKSMPICKAETPMVSFFRLGSLSVSKSQFMNTLINNRHSTFFHKNCPGSTKSRLLMDGVAEIAWYCPAGNPNDAFTDCIAFCNLHGDALSTEKQRNILTEKSSVNVVLVPALKIGDKSWAVISTFFKSSKPLICLIVDDRCDAIQVKDGKYKMGLKDRSQSDVSDQLKNILREILSSLPDPSRMKPSFQLEAMAEVSGIRVDENDTVCHKGKSAALEIMKLLKGWNVSKVKDKFLPCHGRLWREWCRIKKELYHLRGHIEEEKCKKQQELKEIRQKQCKASCSELMKLFSESLSSLPSAEKQYLLKWTQILIDALSTDDLSSILQSYDETWSEVLALKKNHDKSDQLIIKQADLDRISTKLQSATFGLEHIFREMGQIYEAHKSLQKQPTSGQTDWSKYPGLAAELMISGHPMELMDGDAGHVPLTWISSLLDEVIRKLGDKRVFVLSVLGVQSSGKSTMLNAMFGLQFAVSAGRCTRGAFMQLVKVSEEIRNQFRFDYILVVDTEGLRALELAGNTTLHHDNELATFVVGLGNMTLINIFGENPADMQDVLQIVVQAFMRMKKVRLSPSCVFVHQNVTDVAAAEKNMDGKRRLQEKLDQMAQLAAEEEGSDAECFSDVIAFDVQNDVKYFAQLWEGSPPMAPPNPGYSESVQDLKTFILSKASQSDGVTLSEFKSKIQDLWNALLNEHFVFSFKNTLEIAVYRKLEVQYGNWTWALRSNMLTIENQLHTRIENGNFDKVELSFLQKEMSKTYEGILNEMTTYFDDDRDKEMLVQWRGRFENKIKEFHDEQVREVKRKLDEVLQQKKACKKLDDQKTEFENKLLQKSKELAQQLKDKAKNEEELEKKFNSVWSGWVNELTEGIKPIEDINLEEDQFLILYELSFEWALIEKSKNSKKHKNISLVGDYSHYVSFTKHQGHCDKSQKSPDYNRGKDHQEQGTFQKVVKYASKTTTKVINYIFRHFQYEDQQLIRSLIEEVEQQTIDAIMSKPVATRGYSATYLLEVAKTVKEQVREFESKRKYVLKKEFTVDLILYVFGRAESWLSESHKKYQKNNDACAYLESKKPQYYTVFRSFCKGNSSAVVLGELICDKLKVSAAEAVFNQTAIDLAGEMRCSVPAFNGNRMNMEKHVLKSLAEKEDFDGFITYMRRPREHVESFIKQEVEKYTFTENKDKAQKTLKKNVEDIKNHVSQALFTATEKVQTQRGDTNMWLEEFSTQVKDKLTFETIDSQNFSGINKFDFLKEEIEEGLGSIIKDMSSCSLEKMKESRLKPDQILIDQLCKCCWVTCPFCAAVCTNTLDDHSPDVHSVPFHRPSGIKGWHYSGTVEMTVEFCTTKVASDRRFHPSPDSDELIPFKLYRTAGPKYESWRITPDESKLTYWKWFVCRFQEQLENHYNLKFEGRGEIPSDWREHSKEEAIKSLDEL